MHICKAFEMKDPNEQYHHLTRLSIAVTYEPGFYLLICSLISLKILAIRQYFFVFCLIRKQIS